MTVSAAQNLLEYNTVQRRDY